MITTASDIKNNFGKYLKQVTEENCELIITKNNIPVAKLVHYVSDTERNLAVKENTTIYDYHKKMVSYEEFMEIYEKTNTRMEYINGEIIILGAPSIFHQSVLGSLYVLFTEYFKDKKCTPFMAPFDVHFRKHDIAVPDVCQPDLIVLCDIENNVNEKGRYMGTPTLIVEILSPGTRSTDMVYKLNTYMVSGVAEYWIVDPDNRWVTLYTFSDHQINKTEFHKAGETAKSEVFEGLNVDVKYLFDEMNSFM